MAETTLSPKLLKPAQSPDGSSDRLQETQKLASRDDHPTKAMADRQTDPVPETETCAQPVVNHQDRRHK